MASEKLPIDISTTYKELDPNDTIITSTEYQQYNSRYTYFSRNDSNYPNITDWHNDSSLSSMFYIASANENDSLSAYGYQFVELMRKYKIGVATSSISASIVPSPVNTYPSLSGLSGIFLFTVPKLWYDSGIETGSFYLSGGPSSTEAIDSNQNFQSNTSLTSSLYGQNVDIFPSTFVSLLSLGDVTLTRFCHFPNRCI